MKVCKTKYWQDKISKLLYLNIVICSKSNLLHFANRRAYYGHSFLRD